ncbi:MAG: hypothetical protein DWQ01_20360 [Planctomycetota bacterium]|nr:MAG: hypothetical protein DWQ01_20360 [Planctomycetota bacterium]
MRGTSKRFWLRRVGWIWILGLWLACSHSQPPCPPAEATAPAIRPPLSAQGQQDLDLLLSTPRFTDDAIGVGGETPEEVLAWRRLIRTPQAESAFLYLLERGEAPGQLFALCALYSLAPATFQRKLPEFRRRKDEVEFQRGCVISRQAIGEIVDCGHPNAVRLQSPQQTIRAWMEAHPELKSVQYDIAGGAFPAVFAETDGW